MIYFRELLWHWVKAASGERVASQEALKAQIKSLQDSFLFDSLVHIHGAGRLKPARCRQTGRYKTLVSPQQKEDEGFHSVSFDT